MKSLFKEFKKSTKKEWLAKVQKDLKGKPLESLNWEIAPNLTSSPFHHRNDFESLPDPLFEKRMTNQWEKGVRILVNNYKTANREALFLLEKGSNAVCFHLLDIPTKSELNILLANIELEWISTHFILPNKNWKSIFKTFVGICVSRNYKLKKINGSIQFNDPIHYSPADFEALEKYMNALPNFHCVTIKNHAFFQKDNNPAVELANCLQDANILLEKWNKKGLEVKSLVAQIQFSLPLSESYFLNIATIRAFKILWSLLLKGWKIRSKIPCQIETHLFEDALHQDVNHNKIKATTKSMSAIIGGVDRLFIYPTTSSKKQEERTNQQRLNLNIQHVMESESDMDRVVDPAAGSYFIEKLTDDIGETAWEIFTQKNDNT